MAVVSFPARKTSVVTQTTDGVTSITRAVAFVYALLPKETIRACYNHVSVHISDTYCLSVYLFIRSCVRLSVCLSVCFHIHLYVCQSIYLSILIIVIHLLINKFIFRIILKMFPPSLENMWNWYLPYTSTSQRSRKAYLE